MSDFYHKPVLLEESVHWLVSESGMYIDATLGGAGHSKEILHRLETQHLLSNSLLIGIDRDANAIRAATTRLATYAAHAHILRGRFADLKLLLETNGLLDSGNHPIRGILLDLGISSHQIDAPARGFSFQQSGPLDMRMSDTAQLTAAEVVNHYDERSLSKIFFDYGEEREAKWIARKIVEARKQTPLETTAALALLIRQNLNRKSPVEQTKTLARIFQAIRIEVNGELDELKAVLQAAHEVLSEKGRLVVISYHSLEDRIVKQFFNECASEDWGPKGVVLDVPIKTATMKILTKKPVLASEEEIQENSRARSAKLRVAEKI
ncbi:S-adenosyl-methyltransferase MraW [Chloroherpeton thalassium ATCC 35110]|uniref:Ribosomal RNA small subunit methyltransferase H n=1 Tax=Chloroherpeton thalassium (strain ATCC 35110 / GB-78) TaxID=517418 RepID=RSMH_CHLT3|nr:16S rRNA (cytosine(1402)-N(4))-methyltransferase RsmH [Chloroherpeton thalassium]B3QWS9.1 RecName: Full=Ribosomal RNA small subunit methyltransferase H; AltName: Full=16S rRNA m(4)C1402 methyltransferase; AltName: Full=rRNA (cytosine-N(4)-)-methyltransferase RsmH [Chloroherpeton thalassium ATCC 35110]ACF13293.1 S-adenosyl-methyltransferase MraW [Chloroherpeton thalassium ATCC 35110]